MAVCTTCGGAGKIRSKTPHKDKAWETPCPTCHGGDLKQHDRIVRQIDDAEQTLSQMYYYVVGHSPQWSKTFGHQEALDEVKDAMAVLKARSL